MSYARLPLPILLFNALCGIADAIYETVYLCAKETAIGSWSFIFSVIVEFMQMLAFPLQLILIVSDDTSALRAFMDNFLSWPGITGEAVFMIPSSAWLAIYIATLLWIVAIISLSIFVGYQSM